MQSSRSRRASRLCACASQSCGNGCREGGAAWCRSWRHNAPDWRDHACRTGILPFTLMMCCFTALGAFLLSNAYKEGSSLVAGIVLLSIGGVVNLWACFWRSAIGEDGDDRFCTDHDCAPVGCHYVPVFLMIGGAALGLSDGGAGLELCGMLCLFRHRPRSHHPLVRPPRRKAGEGALAAGGARGAQAAGGAPRNARSAHAPGPRRGALGCTMAGESLPLDVDLPDETLRLRGDAPAAHGRHRASTATGRLARPRPRGRGGDARGVVPTAAVDPARAAQRSCRLSLSRRFPGNAFQHGRRRSVSKRLVERSWRPRPAIRRGGDRGSCGLLANRDRLAVEGSAETL